MPFRNLLLLAFKDFFSRKGRLFLSILGIICGVASLLFLLSLIESVKRTVKNELIGKIPITEMTVKPKEEKKGYSLVADYSSFNEDLVEFMRGLPGVDRIYPVQVLDISAQMVGTIRVLKIPVGSFHTETAVFGIQRDIVIDGLRHPEKYVFDPNAKEIPIVISKNTLEIYNIGLAKTLGYGRFHEDALYGQEFELSFGKIPSIDVGESRGGESGDYRLEPVQCRVIGVSKRAPIMGISVPLEYIQYWRERYFRGDVSMISEKKVYEYIILTAKNIKYVVPIQKELEARGLEVRTQKDTLEKLNSISFIMSLVFGTFGLIILIISAISIFNILTMSVNEEKVDVAILRSVGARKIHIRLIYLLKAGLIGLIGAVDGILAGFIIMRIGDRILLNYLQDYPFIPKSFFATTWQLVLVCFFVGFFFSIIAGIVPANHAARLKPAVVLRQG